MENSVTGECLNSLGVKPRTGVSPACWSRCTRRFGGCNYSGRTEETYVHWIWHFIFWNGKRHPATLPLLYPPNRKSRFCIADAFLNNLLV